MKRKILERISHLKERPKQFIGNGTNLSLTYFEREKYLLGYLAGFGQLLETWVENDITTWYSKKTKRESSSVWTNHILSENKGKSDNEIWLILLESVEDFIHENPSYFPG